MATARLAFFITQTGCFPIRMQNYYIAKPHFLFPSVSSNIDAEFFSEEVDDMGREFLCTWVHSQGSEILPERATPVHERLDSHSGTVGEFRFSHCFHTCMYFSVSLNETNDPFASFKPLVWSVQTNSRRDQSSDASGQAWLGVLKED